MRIHSLALAAALASTSLFALAGCEEDKPTNVAPSATALADTKPKAAGAAEFTINKDASKVDFMMEAPREKIRGKVHDTITGDIQIDLSDITKTTAHLYVDIGDIELFQQARGSDDEEYGEEVKKDLQIEHAKQWLEIGPCDDAEDKAKCEEQTKQNRKVEFVITEVKADKTDLSAMEGDERKVTATVTGDFLLHQHKTKKTAELEITVKMNGDKPDSVTVKTVKPFEVGLKEHDVRPREAFGKLAKATLDAITSDDGGRKVADAAQVSVEFTAKFKGMAAGDAKGDAKGDAAEEKEEKTE